MKKVLAVLLAVMMLSGIAVSAFAVDSPTQDTSGAPAVEEAAPVAAAPAEEEEAAPPEEIADAEATEEEAVEALGEVTAESEDAAEGEDAVIVGLGSLPEEATPKMEEDYVAIVDNLVAAKKDLAEKKEAAIPAAVVEAQPAGVTLTASQPFRAVASVYPATITIAVENPADFAGMMAFVNGEWVMIHTVVDEEAGTVTFVLDQPSVLSIITAVVEAA